MEMTERIDLQNIAIQKLIAEIEHTLSDEFNTQNIDCYTVYEYLTKMGFVTICPPKEEAFRMSFLTIDSLKNYNSGKSIKPGNIRLNIRNLIESIPELVSLGVGMVSESPIIVVCGALSLCRKLIDNASLNISKEQAYVIVALWKSCNNNEHKILLNDGFIATNKILNEYGESKMTYKKYNILIDSLVKMKCIELSENTIHLKERISKKYIENL